MYVLCLFMIIAAQKLFYQIDNHLMTIFFLSRRDKIMNYFSVMYQKKLKKDGDEGGEGEEETGKKKGSHAKSM